MTGIGKAVFVSYASEDGPAVRQIVEELRAVGIEVWFDQNELRGGDAWDQKIRRQIQECALFLPVISAHTQARSEGYFRLEWKLAVDRSHLMADDQPFIVPVVIDDTPQTGARVPEKFQAVQWTRIRADAPAAFAARIQSLLHEGPLPLPPSMRPAASKPPAAAVAPDSESLSGRAWALIAGGCLVVVGLGFAVHSSINRGRAPVETTVFKSPSATAPTLSEAKKLTAKADELMQKFDSGADDLAAAEGYLKRALELDPYDAEIWATSSLLNFSFRSRGFDPRPERYAAARSHAERALKLSPDSIEGLFALARWQRDNEEPAVAEATFQRVLARDPNHAGALASLGYLYDRLDRVDEALAMYERAAQTPDRAALARYTQFLLHFRRGHFAEADKAIRASIAVQPSANSQGGLAMLLLTWQGDPERAATAIASGPAATRSEHRIVWLTTYLHLVRRKPDEALRALNRLSDEFIHDNWFVGPKDYFVGLANAQANRMEAARVAWEAALAQTRARLSAKPTDRDLHLMLGELLALLGHREEALREVRLTDELKRWPPPWTSSSVRILARLGLAEDAVPLLRGIRAEMRDGYGWPLTAALLRLDPVWDKIRDHPKFQELLQETDSPATVQRAATP